MKTSKKSIRKNKVRLKSIFLIFVVLALIIGIIAQVIFNIFMWKSTELQNAFIIRTSISEAITNQQAQQQTLVDKQKIPEAKLLLPQENNDVNNIRYTYNEKEDDTPAYIEITSLQITNSGLARIYGQSMHEVMQNVPEAQACFRGFRIYINKQDTQNAEGETKLVSTKKLNDGREVFIVRELGCGKDPQTGSDDTRTFLMNNLEKYLLKIESY